MKKGMLLLSVALVTLVAMVSCGGSKSGPAEKILKKEVYAQVVNKYEYVGDFVDGICIVSTGWRERGAINTKGEEIIPTNLFELSTATEGMLVAQDNEFKYGAYNTKGELVVPFKYDGMKNYNSGLARVKVGGYIDAQYGYIDKAGNEVVPLKYDVAAESFTEGLAYVGMTEGWNSKYGYINIKGEEVIPLMYADANEFHEGMAAVKTKNGYGYINAKGELLTAAKYDDAMPFSGGLALVMKSDKMMIIDKKGEVVYSFGQKIIPAGMAYHDGLLLVCDTKAQKFGYYNEKGEVALPIEYPAADSFNEGKALTVSVEGGECVFNYIDKNGKVIDTIDEDTYEEEYDEIEEAFEVSVERVLGEAKLMSLINKVPDGLSEILPALNLDKLINNYIQAAKADNYNLKERLAGQIGNIVEQTEYVYGEDVMESLEDYIGSIIDVVD